MRKFGLFIIWGDTAVAAVVSAILPHRAIDLLRTLLALPYIAAVIFGFDS